jgi:4-hydroxy-tetrahydrodipicolinate reductase
MPKIVVNGAGGRMGRTVLALALSDNRFKVIGGVEMSENFIGKTVGEICGVFRGNHTSKVVANFQNLDRPDVIVDFSAPSGTMSALEYALPEKVPIVIGTTGFSEDEKAKIKEVSKKIPILMSSNMSYGMNFLFKVLPLFAEKLEGFDVEIVEVHHRGKKDAPSGTALSLADVIDGGIKRRVFGREGKVGERPSNVLGVFGVRGGDVVGDHTVMFLGDGERVEVTHRATSREAFARGALKAALFIVNKKPKLYNMLDVI